LIRVELLECGCVILVVEKNVFSYKNIY